MADKSPDGLPRNKRALVGLIIGILGMATGGTALMMAQKNQEQLGAIIETMNTVSKNMEKVVLDFEVLLEGVIALAADRNSTTLYTNQHLKTVYSIVERARCVDRAKFSALEQGLAIHIYRTYLTDVMHRVMQAATTGKLTPSLLGMQALQAALRSHAALSNSLIYRTPALAYQFGGVYPVSMDMDRLSFRLCDRTAKPHHTAGLSFVPNVHCGFPSLRPFPAVVHGPGWTPVAQSLPTQATGACSPAAKARPVQDRHDRLTDRNMEKLLKFWEDNSLIVTNTWKAVQKAIWAIDTEGKYGFSLTPTTIRTQCSRWRARRTT